MLDARMMQELTTFKQTPKGARLLADDGSQVAWWPKAIAPESHEAACVSALALMVERGIVNGGSK